MELAIFDRMFVRNKLNRINLKVLYDRLLPTKISVKKNFVGISVSPTKILSGIINSNEILDGIIWNA